MLGFTLGAEITNLGQATGNTFLQAGFRTFASGFVDLAKWAGTFEGGGLV